MDIVLYSEINIFSMAILLTIALKISVSEVEMSFKRRLFSLSVWFVLAANFFDFLWKISVTKYWILPLPLVLCINFMYFMCFGLSSYFWFLYSEVLAKKDIFEHKGLILLELVPLLLLAILLGFSMVDGCLFYFDGNMEYHRGPLFYLEPILSYGYIGVAGIKSLVRAFKNKNKEQKEKLMVAVYFSLPILICGVFQIFLQDAPIMTVGLSLSFLLVYVNSVQVLVSVDSLTNISNRRELLRHLSEKMLTLNENEKIYFLFMDIDSFKQINDLYGHSEGDRALKNLATILKSVCNRTGGFCGRYGGDEFAVVQILDRYESIDGILKEIYNLVDVKNKQLALAYNLNISIGYSVYPDQATDVDELISCADTYMYDVKMKKKRNKNYGK